MKFSPVIFTILSNIALHLAQSIAEPNKNAASTVKTVQDQRLHLAGGGEVDEWSVELYYGDVSDGQCSGLHTLTTGGYDGCVPLFGAKCVNLKVFDGLENISACYFILKYDDGEDCSGGTNISKTIQSGEELDGIPIGAGIKYVLVRCFSFR
ncbi:hypothetical protein F5Y19DRAFT_487129 [Xylariaceae sp. FL1651]|nr:hypothetical protein F5Y19DRAFT_487129 [Xylariaceae sp. FL1651]